MVTQQRLKELFSYNADGTFVRHKDGNQVKCNIGTRRYLRVGVDGKAESLHRLIFLYHHGYLPKVIDHIDNDRLNNRIENLRAVTQSQNCQNKTHHKNSTSPYKNVYWHDIAKKWSVSVTNQGKRKYLGVFADIEFADLVATEARSKFHGSFARHF